MNGSARVLISFGRTDPLHLTEATHDIIGDGPTYIWGPHFSGTRPPWAISVNSLHDEFPYHDIIYCGHGATLLEATAAGLATQVLASVSPLRFLPGWTTTHLDHSGRPVHWWQPGSMTRMAEEIRNRRKNMQE